MKQEFFSKSGGYYIRRIKFQEILLKLFLNFLFTILGSFLKKFHLIFSIF